MAERFKEKQKIKRLQCKMKRIWEAASEIKDEAGQIELEGDEVGIEDLKVLKQLADQIEAISGPYILKVKKFAG